MSTVTKHNLITLYEAGEILGAEILSGDNLSIKIQDVGAADLLSDVLALSKPGTLLLTGLVSTQVIRTAVVADLCGVVFVRGKRPGEEILALAKETKIPVLATQLRMFDAAGRLYGAIYGR